MTISAYSGLPGHGKSYGVVKNVIIPSLEKKRTVYTNIPINNELSIERYGIQPVHFEIQDIIENENWFTEVFEAGSVLVLDEVWRLWPSGLKANQAREGDKSFLAEHRHMVGLNGSSTEIVLVTQDLSQIAMFARSLVETTYRVVKMNRIGINSMFTVYVYTGAVTGSSPPASKLENSVKGKFSKEIYSLYSSHTLSETGLAGDESRTDNRFNILKSGRFVGGFAVVVCLGIFSIWGVSTFFTSYNKSPEFEILQNTISTKPNQPIKVAKPANTFLSRATKIIISYNLGIFPDIAYQFQVYIKGYKTDLTIYELASLGYVLKPIKSCLVKINGDDFDGYVMCEEQQEERSFVNNLTALAS